jgi:ribosomal protein S27E
MPKARPVSSPNPTHVDEDRPAGHSTDDRCRYCGNEDTASAQSARKARKALRERARTFQVVVACVSCGAAFAALSRN